MPNYDKYTYNARALQRIKGAWNNKVFGGSVLKPIKASMTGLGGIKERKPGGGKLEKKVPLKKLIEEADIDTGNGGSFYCLKNGIGSEGWGNVEDGGLGTGLLLGLSDILEDRQAQVLSASLASVNTTNHVGSVGDCLLRVESALKR